MFLLRLIWTVVHPVVFFWWIVSKSRRDLVGFVRRKSVYTWNENGLLMERAEGQVGNVGKDYLGLSY